MAKEKLIQYLRVSADLADSPGDGIAHVGVAPLRQAIALLMLETSGEPTGECICPTCGIRHGGSNLDGGF